MLDPPVDLRSSKAWLDTCAQIVEAIGTPQLPQCIAQSLATLVPYDVCRTIVFHPQAGPEIIHDSDQEQLHGTGWENYRNLSYAVSPAYGLYRRGRIAGVYRLRDLAPMRANIDNPAQFRVSLLESEEAGYLTEGLPSGNEELFVGVELPGGSGAHIALLRQRSAEGYSQVELGLVDAVRPVLASAFKRHWITYATASTMPADRSLSYGAFDGLTPREAQIATLLLQGHSSLSLSIVLGISVTTVKSHRKNIYAKLRISTLQELFSRCNEELSTRLFRCSGSSHH